MQEALSSISLPSQNKVEEIYSNRVLLGKVLATRSFKIFTITEIVHKTWRTKMRIRIEKLDENVFKFTFGDNDDRDYIFKGHPWSLNGVHLILKEWAITRGLKKISFHYSTFTIQVHDFPPIYIHKGTTRKGRGDSRQSSLGISKKNMCRGKSIPHIQGGHYGYRANTGVLFPIWIPATITTCNGISAKLYGPWLRSKHNESLMFVNTLEKEEEFDQQIGVKEVAKTNLWAQENKTSLLGESIEQAVAKMIMSCE